MKKIIILSLFIIAGCMLAGQSVLADTSIIVVTPSTGNKDIGSSFDVLVQLDPAGNEACVAKGTLNLNNLACQNITLATGVAAQTAPTCNSPAFVLGIPKCTTALQDIMAVSVKGISPGTADLSFADVSVLSSNATLDSSSNNGTYNITAISGASTVIAPAEPKITVGDEQKTTNGEITNGETISTEETENSLTSEEEKNSAEQPAALAETGLSSFFSNWIVWLIIIILLVAIVWWLSSKKEDKTQE